MDEYVQEYLTNLPENQVYGFQTCEDGRWGEDWTVTTCGNLMIRVPILLTYDQAVDFFTHAEGTARVVKYSKYLAKGKIVVHSVIRYKEIKS